jgi:anti-sigma-K factor RskA
MSDDDTTDGPEENPEAADALTAALAAASPHRPPPELRARVLRHSVRKGRLVSAWRYATVAALVAAVTGIVTWNVAAAQQQVRSRSANPDVAQLEATNEVVFDVIACKGGHVALLKAVQSGSVGYGKLYTCPASNDVVFMSGKLSPAPSDMEYELWLTEDGVTRLQGRLKVWPSLTGSGYYFGAITLKADQKDPSYEAAQLTLQPPGGAAPENPILHWSGE